MQMKSLLFVSFMLLFASKMSAQANSIEKTNSIELMARAKALGFVIIEDRWARTFSAGAEVRFYDQFSLVVDLVHFRWRNEVEVYTTPDYSEYVEFSEYDARNYLATELRYYPKFFKKYSYRPYGTVFSKFGKRNLNLEENYPLKEGTILRLNSTFYDLGTALGVEIGQRFGFDFNLGVAYRTETKSEDIYHVDEPVSFTKNVSDNRWIPTIRVNFYWNFSSNLNQKLPQN